MSLRLKLLALGLATLALPWAGCRYAREMEAALREGEQTSLQAVAQTIAASLQGRTDLLYRQQDGPASPAPAGRFDLKPLTLSAAPLVDGYADDWPRAPAAWAWFTHDAHHRFGILTGVFERMLYVLLEVHDEHPLFDAPGSNWLDAATLGDRVWIGYEDSQGEEQQFFLAATGPGALSARRIEAGEFGEQHVSIEPRVRAAWQATGAGYRVEVRLPLSMLGEHFGVLIDDRDARGGPALSYGTLRSEDLHTLGRLIVAAPRLSTYLAQFMQPGLKLAITAPDGQVLARVDALAQGRTLSSGAPLLARLYRRFIDRPGAPSVIEAHAPIYARDSPEEIGALEVTQTPDRWLRLRDRALTRMLNFTLGTSVVAMLLMFAFAAWLALRLARLRRASESALTRTGLVTAFPETRSRDELGDVARSFSTLLGRLDAYTDYLRTLAGKLAHEIRTPLTIVRSSLENLEAEPAGAAARTYLERARQGSERLNAILLAMSAASRVEEAIGSAERIDFDVVALLDSAVAAYRSAFPGRAFALEVPAGPIMLHGAPDLIVQMLDKLIDNAVDFSPTDATITVRLRLESAAALIEVENPGPPLPAHLQGRLFDSLWQSRTDRDSRPHFGLGLYIVRLIAEFHGGEATAVSLPDGARLSVRLPR